MSVSGNNDRKSLTRDYRETTLEILGGKPEHRVEVLAEGVQCMVGGEVGLGKSLLLDCIDAKIGFAGLAELTGKSVAELKLLFSSEGDASARDILGVINCLRQWEGVELAVRPVPIESVGGGRRARGRYTRRRRARTGRVDDCLSCKL